MTDHQKSLWSPIEPVDPNVDDSDRPRLRGQSAAILARLRRGPATNADLAQLALKYTSRISDCRAAGYDIRMVRKDSNGRTWYQLFDVR